MKAQHLDTLALDHDEFRGRQKPYRVQLRACWVQLVVDQVQPQ